MRFPAFLQRAEFIGGPGGRRTSSLVSSADESLLHESCSCSSRAPEEIGLVLRSVLGPRNAIHCGQKEPAILLCEFARSGRGRRSAPLWPAYQERSQTSTPCCNWCRRWAFGFGRTGEYWSTNVRPTRSSNASLEVHTTPPPQNNPQEKKKKKKKKKKQKRQTTTQNF